MPLVCICAHFKVEPSYHLMNTTCPRLPHVEPIDCRKDTARGNLRNTVVFCFPTQMKCNSLLFIALIFYGVLQYLHALHVSLLQNHRCLICNWLEHCQFPLVSFCLFKIPLSKRRLTWSFFLNQFSLSKFLPCDSSSTRKDISVQALYFIFGMKLLKDWFQSYSYLPFQQRQIISKYFQLHS